MRFSEQVTLHLFSPSDAALAPTSPNLQQSFEMRALNFDSSLRPTDIASAIKPGMTPILPEERSTSFAKWCSSRRSRPNESDDLRRKSMRSVHSPSSGSCMVPMGGGALDSRTSLSLDGQWGSVGGRSPAARASRSPGGAAALAQTALTKSLSSTAHGTNRWWLERGDGACDYCKQILSEAELMRGLFAETFMRSLVPQSSPGMPPSAALLQQTSRGVRRWVGFQVVRHVLALMDQVDKDAAKGMHKPQVPKPQPAAAPAAGGFGGGGGGFGFGGGGGGAFGAPAAGFGGAAANPQQQQQQQQEAAERARTQGDQDLIRAAALDRLDQVIPCVFLPVPQCLGASRLRSRVYGSGS